MFDAEKFIQEKVRELRNRIRGKAIIRVSGGVDSTTSAILVYRAIGESLLCALVDTGYMRKNETENNERLLKKLGLNVLVVDAKKGSTTSQAPLLTVRDIPQTLPILGEIEALSTQKPCHARLHKA